MNDKLLEINNYRTQCHKRIFYHKKCVEHYQRINNIYNIGGILLVSFTGTSNIIVSSVNQEYSLSLGIINGIVLYLSGVVTGLQAYFNYAELIEKHKTSVIRYKNLFNSINEYINNTHRTEDYYNLISEEMKSMIDCPDIPLWMINLNVPDLESSAEFIILEDIQKEDTEEIDRKMDFELRRFNSNNYRDPSGSSAST